MISAVLHGVARFWGAKPIQTPVSSTPNPNQCLYDIIQQRIEIQCADSSSVTSECTAVTRLINLCQATFELLLFEQVRTAKPTSQRCQRFASWQLSVAVCKTHVRVRSLPLHDRE
jgi:hypothetical protein